MTQSIIVTPEGQAYGPFTEPQLTEAIAAEAERRYGVAGGWDSTNLIGDGYLIIPLNPGADLVAEARRTHDQRADQLQALIAEGMTPSDAAIMLADDTWMATPEQLAEAWQR